MYQDD